MQTIFHLTSWYNSGYTSIMKTAISIPEELFESAEQFARGRGMSRSELYATALRQYLEAHRGEMITERGGLDPEIARLQSQSLREDDW
jgi:hypothetical protein